MSHIQRVVILVSSDPSDIFFANQISKQVGAVGVVVEHQDNPGGLKLKINKILRLSAHPLQFIEVLQRRKLEKVMQQKAHAVTLAGFDAEAFALSPPAGCEVVHVMGKNAINSPAACAAIGQMKPDLIAVCGTSILKEEILSIPPSGVLNLHGGLPQRYRGVWTTHWAVVNEEPEYIGATVHFVSPGIDDGDIVLQGRPDLDGTENPESLYVKVVKLGIEMMVAAIGDVGAGGIQRYPLETKGRLYLSKMMTPEILQQAWANTDSGILRDYLADKDARDAEVIPLLRGGFRCLGGS